MAIFPPYEANYTDPTFDSFMNYGCGTLLLLISILALFFNAVVFYVNVTQERISTTRGLFLIVASSDFLYTLFKGLFATYNLLNPNVKPWVDNSQPTLLQFIVNRVGWDGVYTSISAVFSISVFRFIKLVFPLWATVYSKATVVIAVVPTVVTLLCVAGRGVAIDIAFKNSLVYWNGFFQLAYISDQEFNNFILNILWLLPLLSGLSIILTLVTIAKVSRDQQHIRINNIMTILLLAVGDIGWTAITIEFHCGSHKTTGLGKSAALAMFLFYVILPSLVALYNPLVLCVGTTDMRAELRNIFQHLGIYRRGTEYEIID